MKKFFNWNIKHKLTTLRIVVHFSVWLSFFLCLQLISFRVFCCTSDAQTRLFSHVTSKYKCNTKIFFAVFAIFHRPGYFKLIWLEFHNFSQQNCRNSDNLGINTLRNTFVDVILIIWDARQFKKGQFLRIIFYYGLIG